MNCEFRRGRVIDLARGGAADAEIRDHLRECAECARAFEEQAALTTLITEVAREESCAPPGHIEPLVLAEFQAVRGLGRRRWRVAAAFGALAAAVAGFALLHSTTARPKPVAAMKASARLEPAPVAREEKPAMQSVRRKPAPGRNIEEAPFVEIPYTLPLDPHEPVTVMRVSMPVTALVAVGLAAAAPDPSAYAQADALVSEDGRIRALRLVSYESSDFSSDR